MNELLDIISRSIGRTAKCQNYHERAADVLRSVQENDFSLPQPTQLIEDEITILRAELNDFKDAADSEAQRVNELTEQNRKLIEENTKLRNRNTLMKNTRNEQLFEKLMDAHEEIERLSGILTSKSP